MADKRPQNLEQYYQDAKKALQPYALRSAEAERDYATEWMASCASYQDALNEALENIQVLTQEVVALRVEVVALRKELAAKDRSFKPPPVGIA